MLSSPRHNRLLRTLAIIAFVLAGGRTTSSTSEQPTLVQLTVVAPTEVRVSVRAGFAAKRWSFRNSYGSAFGLGDRIENFQASKVAGRRLSVRNLASGEFQSDEEATDYSYTVKLPKADARSLPQVSWLTSDYGVLMLADLLPDVPGAKVCGQGVLVDLTLPNHWIAQSSLVAEGNRYKVGNPESTVFFVGSSLRAVSKNVQGMSLQIFVSGNWPFGDSKALDMAAKVLRSYFFLIRFRLRERCVVMIAPMPFTETLTTWKAETRGSSIILAINPTARVTTWPGQLGVIFTHEVFHLWVPNSLNLTGDYDWFFEGFTLYQGLLTALDLKLITFSEYLNTLARVYDSYLAHPDNQSLLDVSERRWTSESSAVYDKGMLVAFMYDLALRQESNGNERLPNIYATLFSQFAGKQADANKAIMTLLGSSTAMRNFTSSFIESKSTLDLEHFLADFGFELDTAGARSRLMIRTQLTQRQRALLHSLGFRK